MPETVGDVLFIGGTGILRPAVHELVDRGHRVVVVSRWPEQAVRPETGLGEFVPVRSDAIVVQIWGSAAEGPRKVILGYTREAGVSRWLSHTEISDGVLGALDRPEALHVIGQIDPWVTPPVTPPPPATSRPAGPPVRGSTTPPVHTARNRLQVLTG